jgi:epoxyqueuosine reductase QueG
VHVERSTVIDAARAAGADAVRIASAAALPQTRAALAASFARGDLAAWPYDASYAERAADPERLLPGARSIICIAVA